METETRSTTPRNIIILEDIISEMSGVEVPYIRSRMRDKTYSDARHAVWYMANIHMKYSLKQLARIYKRDHTTVLSGVRKMKENKFGENVAMFIKNKHPELLEGKEFTKKKPPENWGI
jgi:chromosomal replication initiation ATPase DnaA